MAQHYIIDPHFTHPVPVIDTSRGHRITFLRRLNLYFVFKFGFLYIIYTILY